MILFKHFSQGERRECVSPADGDLGDRLRRIGTGPALSYSEFVIILI